MRTARLSYARLLESARNALRFLRDFPSLAGFAVFAAIFLVGSFFCRAGTVRVRIRLDAPMPGGVQFYYRDEHGQAFSEERCVSVRVDGPSAVADVALPVRQLCSLRIDFGVAPGEFTILEGRVGPIPLPRWRKWHFSPDVKLMNDGDKTEELRLFSEESCYLWRWRPRWRPERFFRSDC